MIIVDFTDGSPAHQRRRWHLGRHVRLPGLHAGGDLIGAVAYGLSYGPSPIAGVTPFEEMDDYLAAGCPRPTGKVAVDKAMAKKIAAGSDVSRARRLEQGFEQLGIPTGVSGVGASRLAKLTHAKRAYFPKSAYAAGRVSPGAATADDVVAGGNLAATYSYGDIVFGGVGTATSVCDNKVVGFGHPMDFLGETTLSLHPASAIYIQPDSLGAPFKVANFAAPVGTINEDHQAGITGFFGATPHGATVTSDVTYKARHREGSTTVTVPDAWASVTFYQQIANHDRVIDAIKKGSETQTWTITGSQDGTPFSLLAQRQVHVQLRHLLRRVVRARGPHVPAQLGRGRGPRRRHVTGTVSDSTATFRVAGNEQLVKGAWTKVNNRNPAVVSGRLEAPAPGRAAR